jgi:hypothetical protein
MEARHSQEDEILCCANCLQCLELRDSGEAPIRVGSHHSIQVRVAILADYEIADRYERPYKIFRHVVMDDNHAKATNLTGLTPYWRRNKFYENLYKEAKAEIARAWPFGELREAGVEVKFKPHSVTYDGYENKTTKACKVTMYTKQHKIHELPAPRHVTKSHPTNESRIHKREYDGIFTVHLIADCDTEKVRAQRTLYADDRLAQRLKAIMNDKRAEIGDLYCIGAILIALSAYRHDDMRDRMGPQFPPYKKTGLRATMDKDTWNEYNSLLENSRGRNSQLELTDQGSVTQATGKRDPTLPIHGPQEVTRTTAVGRNGAKAKRPVYTKATNKPRPATPYRIPTDSSTQSCSGPPVKERSSYKLTRTLIHVPIATDPTENPQQSNDSGEKSSVTQRRSVFERLSNPKPDQKKTDVKDDKDKEKDDGNAKRSRRRK